MPRRTIFLSRIKCRVCKTPFQPKAITSVMCSEVCRNINKRMWSSDRMKRMRERRSIQVVEIKCKNCKKIFYPVPSNRKFCTKNCSQSYRPRKKISDAKYKRRDFKNFTLQKRHTDTKDFIREEVDEAVKKFLKGGGKIQKLESLPLPKIPTVGSRDWDWETTVGLGFAGLEDLAEPEYNIENVIKP